MNKDAVILVPIYNPNEKIVEAFLKELTKEYNNVVFINDGCEKKHDKFWDKISKEFPVIKHNVNLGKGRGLKNGINYILNNYPEAKVIVTADCDGQHSVEDIGKCYQVALKNNDSLILGCRDFDLPDVPSRSKYGNKITKNILNQFVGQKLSDTQTGLRAMSLNVARSLIDIPGERYEYETNVLIYCRKLHIPIKEVTIKTIYIDANDTSHFNPVKDSIRIYKFFAKYIIVALFAYIIETIMFCKLMDININPHIGIPLFLLVSRIVSNLLILGINKHVSIGNILLSYVVVTAILMLINTNMIIVKVIVDLLLLIIGLLFTNFKTKKEL